MFGFIGKSRYCPDGRDLNRVFRDTKWVRSDRSGFLHVKVAMHQYVEAGGVLCTISDPHGTMSVTKADHVINISRAPMVYEGDAIFNLGLQQ